MMSAKPAPTPTTVYGRASPTSSAVFRALARSSRGRPHSLGGARDAPRRGRRAAGAHSLGLPRRPDRSPDDDRNRRAGGALPVRARGPASAGRSRRGAASLAHRRGAPPLGASHRRTGRRVASLRRRAGERDGSPPRARRLGPRAVDRGRQRARRLEGRHRHWRRGDRMETEAARLRARDRPARLGARRRRHAGLRLQPRVRLGGRSPPLGGRGRRPSAPAHAPRRPLGARHLGALPALRLLRALEQERRRVRADRESRSPTPVAVSVARPRSACRSSGPRRAASRLRRRSVELNSKAAFLYHVARRHGNPPPGVIGPNASCTTCTRASSSGCSVRPSSSGWSSGCRTPVASAVSLHLDFTFRTMTRHDACVIPFRAIELPTQASGARRGRQTSSCATRRTRSSRRSRSEVRGSCPPAVRRGPRARAPIDLGEERFDAWGEASLRRGRRVLVVERDGRGRARGGHRVGRAGHAPLRAARRGAHLRPRTRDPARRGSRSCWRTAHTSSSSWARGRSSTRAIRCSPRRGPKGAVDLGLTHCTMVRRPLLAPLLEHVWHLTMGDAE